LHSIVSKRAIKFCQIYKQGFISEKYMVIYKYNKQEQAFAYSQ